MRDSRAKGTAAGVLVCGLLAASLAGCKGYVALRQPDEPVVGETTQAGAVTEASEEVDGAASAQKPTEQAPSTEAGTVVVLATGGTIAGSGAEGKSVGYTSGAITAEQLIGSVPEIKDVAPIEAVQVCNDNSDDITSDIWMRLAHEINERAADPNVVGFVVTHGTDTLEETAYFLDLVVKTDKPVVLTGSMRPSTAISPDGPQNLYDAVVVASAPASIGRGALVTFADRIYTARAVLKTSTYYVGAISAGEEGDCGVVRDDRAFFDESSARAHTTTSEFDVSDMTELPRVSVVYFNVDADPGMLTYAAEHADGIVVAGAGAGEYSQEFLKTIEGLEKPVVISSRINDGIVVQEGLLCKDTVAACDLPPQKAAVLMRLALATGDASNERLVRLFATY